MIGGNGEQALGGSFAAGPTAVPVPFGRDASVDGANPASAPQAAARAKLSVAMPAHNEESTIAHVAREVLSVDGPFDIELIVVDDGSTDGTAAAVRTIYDPRLVLVSKPHREGKGAAVRTAASVATGQYLLIFDADSEYEPGDIATLMEPVLNGTAQVVYGARVSGIRTAFPSSRYKLGSDLTTLFTNILFDAWLQDLHTCLKLVPLALFRQLSLSEVGFGLDTELTCELLRRGIRPYELPCSYRGRSQEAGKKITLSDGVHCVRVALRVRRRGLLATPPGTSAYHEHPESVLDPTLEEVFRRGDGGRP